MKIVFIEKSTGQPVENQHDYFVMSDMKVYRDNYKSFESQSCVVTFEDFVKHCPEVTWKLEK